MKWKATRRIIVRRKKHIERARFPHLAGRGLSRRGLLAVLDAPTPLDRCRLKSGERSALALDRLSPPAGELVFQASRQCS